MTKTTIGPATLYLGDCLETLRGMPDNSVDSICTDPPYGLSDHKPGEVVACLQAWLAGEVYAPKGKGFMGKSWDAWVPGPEVWRECLRVLKPGGHVLAFAGTRSMDLISMALRLAGFELRDSIGYAHDGGGAPLLAWTFGQGFPKSHDVSKAIDREAGVEREKKQIAYSTNVLAQGIGVDRPWMREAEKNGYHEVDGDTPATEAARKWQGWGSALKPAWEPILLARKPLQGTIAQNVLAWGTGGLNIDGSRIGTESTRRPTGKSPLSPSSGWNENSMGNIIGGSDSGRWPANLILQDSDEVRAGFPDTAPSKAALRGDVCDMRGGNYGNSQGSRQGTESVRGHTDNGGSAARFFQQCKSSYDEVWHDLNLPQENANTAEQSSSRSRQAAVSALVLAVNSALHEGLLCSGLSMAPSTSATASELKLIAETATQAIQNIGARFWHESKPARLSLSLSHASDVEIQKQTDTTTITVSHWKSDGSAEPVTFSITRTSLEAGVKDCAPFTGGKRFMYCAKASKKDRDEGLHGFDVKRTPAMAGNLNDGQRLSGDGKPISTPSRANTHPTVKPTDLMAYLCRLITPPGGVVLDPFMGSGSTGKAAMREGFHFIGCELSPEYIAIASARIEHEWKKAQEKPAQGSLM